MRALIVSDVHSNEEAFSQVIADANSRGGFDEVWSLGDLIGYGPDPVTCIDLLRKYPHKAVAGNHDLASIGEISLREFNPYAAEANRWTGLQLNDDHKAYIAAQPATIEFGEFTLVHGSPRDPVWEYVISVPAAEACFSYMKTEWCLLGHSHLPFLCVREGGRAKFLAFPEDIAMSLDPDEMLIVNPGSVGQPRDDDPRASYAIYDSEARTISHHRVAYDIAATQKKMRKHGLPKFLIERLALGQ
jgi:diadenosine tetraphosphatase ApaH/serine/threonine PP2A family protein phosphatase